MISTGVIALPSSAPGRPFSNEIVCRSGARGFVNASVRKHPRAVRNAAGRGERFLAADGHAPQAAIDRIRGAERRHRQIALLQILELVLPLEGLVAHGREHFEIRRERAQRHFEAHLIVAGGGAAVRDHAGAELARHVRDGLRLHHALGAYAQRIELATSHVPHDEETQHLLEVIRARIDDVMLDGAERLRALLERARGLRVDAAGVDRHGDDRAVVVLGHPRHEERRVESAGVSEDDGLGAHGRIRVGHGSDSEDGAQTLDQLGSARGRRRWR